MSKILPIGIRKVRKAFSLVELLIVVTIISVLTGAALPFVSEYLETARSAKAANDLDEFARAINNFEIQEGREFNDTTGQSLVGRFLQKIPADPWGVPYSFASATDQKGAFVSTAGPDRLFGTDDDTKAEYKGKLALVSAKWSDVNADGLLSISTITNPSTDSLILRFNRAATTTVSALNNTANWSLRQPGGGETFDTYFEIGATNLASGSLSADGKQLTFKFQLLVPPPTSVDDFVLGLSQLIINNNTAITDPQGNPSIVASVTVFAR